MTGLRNGDSLSSLSEVYNTSKVGGGRTLTINSYTINDGNSGHNYTVTTVANTAGLINKATLTITAKANTKTYDSTTSAAAVPIVTGLKGADSVTGLLEVYSSSSATASKTLSVSAYVVNDGNSGNNYTLTTASIATGVINKAPLTITALTNTKTYDSTTSAAATPTFSGLMGSDAVTGLTEVYSSSSAASGKTLSVSAYTINDGNSGNNYTVVKVTNTTGVITKAALTVTGITANNKVYDGTTAATLNTASAVLAGFIGSDTATLVTPPAPVGTFAVAGPANNIPVTISGLTLSGSAAGNYTVAQATASANITAPQGYVGDSGTSQLTLTLAANQTLGIVANNGSYTLTSNQNFIPFYLGVDPANQATAFSGFGTKTLTITSAGIAQYTTGISIVDGGANTSVTFNNSGTNAYANAFTVALTNAAAGAISFNGSSSFGDFNFQAATSQAIFVNNGAMISTNNGNLTLQANQQATASTGDFAGVTVNKATIRSTGTGQVNIQAKAGTTGTSTPYGVYIENGGTIAGGTADLSITGTGGRNALSKGHGVYLVVRNWGS